MERNIYLRRVKTDEEKYINLHGLYWLNNDCKVVNLFKKDKHKSKDFINISCEVRSFISDLEDEIDATGNDFYTTILVDVKDVYDQMMLSELIEVKLKNERVEISNNSCCKIRVRYFLADGNFYNATY